MAGGSRATYYRGMAADQPQLRISDAEREDALEVLTEHVRTGRLDLVEFEERSAQVSTAKRRGDLEELFHDLPDPKPAVLRPVVAVSPPIRPMPRTPPWQPTSWRPPSASRVLPIVAVLAGFIVLVVLTRGMAAMMLWPLLIFIGISSCRARRRW